MNRRDVEKVAEQTHILFRVLLSQQKRFLRISDYFIQHLQSSSLYNIDNLSILLVVHRARLSFVAISRQCSIGLLDSGSGIRFPSTVRFFSISCDLSCDGSRCVVPQRGVRVTIGGVSITMSSGGRKGSSGQGGEDNCRYKHPRVSTTFTTSMLFHYPSCHYAKPFVICFCFLLLFFLFVFLLAAVKIPQRRPLVIKM